MRVNSQRKKPKQEPSWNRSIKKTQKKRREIRQCTPKQFTIKKMLTSRENKKPWDHRNTLRSGPISVEQWQARSDGDIEDLEIGKKE